jgi:hypothetical protein
VKLEVCGRGNDVQGVDTREDEMETRILGVWGGVQWRVWAGWVKEEAVE